MTYSKHAMHHVQVPLLRQRTTDASTLCVNCDVSFTNGLTVSDPTTPKPEAPASQTPSFSVRPSTPPASAGTSQPAAADTAPPVPRPSPGVAVRRHSREEPGRASTDGSARGGMRPAFTFGEPPGAESPARRSVASSGGDSSIRGPGIRSSGGGGSFSAASHAEEQDAVLLEDGYQVRGHTRAVGQSPVLASTAERSMGLGGPGGDGTPVPRYSWGSPAASSDRSSWDAAPLRGAGGGGGSTGDGGNTGSGGGGGGGSIGGGSTGREASQGRTDGHGLGAAGSRAEDVADEGRSGGEQGIPGAESPTADARLGPFARHSTGAAAAIGQQGEHNGCELCDLRLCSSFFGQYNGALSASANFGYNQLCLSWLMLAIQAKIIAWEKVVGYWRYLNVERKDCEHS